MTSASHTSSHQNEDLDLDQASSAPGHMPVPRRPAGRPRTWAVAAGLALLVALLLAVLAGTVLGRRSPGDDSAEAGFARDMQVHHAQAVAMSMTVRDLTQDDAVRTMAYDIALTQQQQAGQLFGWLTQWNLTATSTEAPGAWMSGASTPRQMPGNATPDASAMPGMTGMRAAAGGRMPGMATRADLARLAASRGRAAEVLWLQLMIAHHRGGIVMARAVLDRTSRPEVRSFARNLIDSQQAEITAMTAMLDQRGGTA